MKFQWQMHIYWYKGSVQVLLAQVNRVVQIIRLRSHGENLQT